MMEIKNCYKSTKPRRMPDGTVQNCEAWIPVTDEDRDRFRANGKKPEIRKCVSHEGSFRDFSGDGYHRETTWKPVGASDDPRDGEPEEIRTNGLSRRGGIKFDPEKVCQILAAGILDGANLTEMIHKPEAHSRQWLALIWLMDGETINGETVKLNATVPDEIRNITPGLLDVARDEREKDKIINDLITSFTS